MLTGFAVAYGVFQLLHGPLGDRFGKLRIICGAMVLSAVASAACAFADSLAELTVFRFISGVTIGAIIPLSLAHVGDTVAFEQRQSVMGRFIAGGLIGSMAGPLVAGLCIEYYDWRASFLIVAAGFAIVAAMTLPHALNESPATRNRQRPLTTFLALARLPGVRLTCGTVAIEGWLYFGAFGYLGAFLVHETGLSYALVGGALSASGLGGLLYSASVRRLLKTLGVVKMVLMGGGILLCAFLTLANTSEFVVAALVIFTMGLGFSLMHNTLQTQASEMAPQSRGSGLAMFAFSLFVGQALGIVAAGLMVEHFGYRPMLVFTGLAIACLAVFLASRLAGRARLGETR